MLELLGELHRLPGIVLVLGALVLPFLPVALRRVAMVALPIASYAHLLAMPAGVAFQVEIMGGLVLEPVRIDALAMVWGHIFHIVAILASIYSLHVAERGLEHVAALSYAGSAIGAVMAGDFVTLFVYWELTAVTSVFLIWSPADENLDRDPAECLRTGMRYLVIQVSSGVILLAGALAWLSERGWDPGALRFDAVHSGSIFDAGLGAQLIFLAFGIKAAFPLLHNWLQDAYPKGTHTGTVVLSAFTTKMAIYALARGFAGTEELIALGVFMTLFPIPFAVLENDLRRVLAYSLNNQLGFMCVGIGIGTAMSINGAAAHAFAHILYKSLLFMAMGAVLYKAGTCKATEIGGLYRKMPWTAVLCIVGSLSISAMPLFSGFTTKSLTMTAAGEAHLTWVALLLLVASAGVVEHSGIKIPYSGFFSKEEGKKITSRDIDGEAPLNMRIAMGLTAAMCIGLGLYPAPLYAILPTPTDYQAYTAPHVVSQLQLLFFAALAYVLLKKRGLYPKETRKIFIDSDVLYRKAAPAIARAGWTRVLEPLWTGVLGLGMGLLRGTLGALFRWTGPGGIFGRSWTAGGITRWSGAMIAFYLLYIYLWS